MPKYLCVIEIEEEYEIEAKDRSEAIDKAEEVFYEQVDYRDLDIDISCRKVSD